MNQNTAMQNARLNDAIDTLNRQIVSIWNDSYPRAALDNGFTELGITTFRHLQPIQYPKVFIGDHLQGTPQQKMMNEDRTAANMNELLLFVGLNPSTTSRGGAHTAFAQGAQLTNADSARLSNNMQTDFAVHPYFKQIREFRTTMPKYHIDLFAFHHTTQQHLVAIIAWACAKKDATLLSFFMQQIEAVHEFIDIAAPEQAILLNSLTRDIFSGAKLSKNSATYSMINNRVYSHSTDWINSPARLEHNTYAGYMHHASMLSGQRAMDVGSRIRLESTVERAR